jgi:hypothetical protein
MAADHCQAGMVRVERFFVIDMVMYRIHYHAVFKYVICSSNILLCSVILSVRSVVITHHVRQPGRICSVSYTVHMY